MKCLRIRVAFSCVPQASLEIYITQDGYEVYAAQGNCEIQISPPLPPSAAAPGIPYLVCASSTVGKLSTNVPCPNLDSCIFLA